MAEQWYLVLKILKYHFILLETQVFSAMVFEMHDLVCYMMLIYSMFDWLYIEQQEKSIYDFGNKEMHK